MTYNEALHEGLIEDYYNNARFGRQNHFVTEDGATVRHSRARQYTDFFSGSDVVLIIDTDFGDLYAGFYKEHGRYRLVQAPSMSGDPLKWALWFRG